MTEQLKANNRSTFENLGYVIAFGLTTNGVYLAVCSLTNEAKEIEEHELIHYATSHGVSIIILFA